MIKSIAPITLNLTECPFTTEEEVANVVEPAVENTTVPITNVTVPEVEEEAPVVEPVVPEVAPEVEEVASNQT